MSDYIKVIVVMQGVVLALALALGWLLAVPIWSFFTLEPMHFLYGVAGGVFLLAYVLMSRWVPESIGKTLKQDADSIFMGLELSYADILAGALIIGITEELLFRGVLQTYLVGLGWFSGAGAVLIVALGYGFLFFRSWVFLVYLVIVDCALGFLFLWSGSLTPSIVASVIYSVFVTAWGTRFRTLTTEVNLDEPT